MRDHPHPVRTSQRKDVLIAARERVTPRDSRAVHPDVSNSLNNEKNLGMNHISVAACCRGMSVFFDAFFGSLLHYSQLLG